MDSETRERALVLRAQSGDRDAFDRLLRDVSPPLHRFVKRTVGDDALADDILQQTLILIVRKLRWLNDPKLFRSWAYRIAAREAFRAMRKRHRVEEGPLEELAAPEPQRSDPWLLSRLDSAITRMSPASRAVVTLHYLEEVSLSEVAAILGLSIGTVKSRLAYGLAQLRKETK
jgi:RNA polymerase sigma-70 factor (ECF subfamily)